MIKIIFEVNENFIKEGLDPESLKANVEADGKIDFMKELMNLLCFTAINRHIEQGKTEFTVTTDKLDEKSLRLYDATIPAILGLAAFSEDDKIVGGSKRV